MDRLTTNTTNHFPRKAWLNMPAADLLEGEKLATEHSSWKRAGTTAIDGTFLHPKADGNSSRAEKIDYTGSCFSVIVGRVERLRRFVSVKVCKKLVSVLSCNVKHFIRFFSAYRNYISIQKYLKCTKANIGSTEEFDKSDTKTVEKETYLIFMMDPKKVARTQI